MTRTGPGESPPGRAKTRDVQVLVVDAEPLIRWALHQGLSSHGWNVAVAGSGREALAGLSARHRPVDVVLLDLCLPDCMDLEVLADLRRVSPATIIVLMTAFADADVRARARDLGVRAFVDKPFRVDEVVELVASILLEAGPILEPPPAD